LSRVKGRKAYFAASLVAQVSALLRYVILARVLGQEELGLAAMLILTAQFFDSISDTGSDRFIVQDADGDSPTLQGVVQLALAARGLFIASALLIFSGLLASLYHQPELRTPLIVIGLAPLIAGFVHLDLRRAQRTQDFRLESLDILTSETVSLLATATAAFLTHSHNAVIFGLVLRAITLVIVSHVTARRPYRWAFGRAEVARFSAFAMPLFLNGLLLFLGSQGDRLVVGSTLGAAVLGQYSAVLLLAYYPTSMLTRFLAGIHLPQVAAARIEPDKITSARERLASRTQVLTIGIALGFAVVAPIAVPLLYGGKFKEPLLLTTLIGVLQAARFMRVWPTTLAIGAGRSLFVMINNIGRMVGLPMALFAYSQFHTLWAVTIGFTTGELTALLVGLALLYRTGHLEPFREFKRVFLFCVVVALTIAATWFLDDKRYTLAAVSAAAMLPALAVIAVQERATLAEAFGMAERYLGRLRPRRAAS